MWHAGDQVVPGYRLEKFLGRGQFGEVWQATSPGGTVCALKLLNLGGKQGWKEFRAIQQIKLVRHPHLAPFNAIWLLDENGQVLEEDAVASLGREEPKTRATLTPQIASEAACQPATLVVATVLGDKTLGARMRECQEQDQPGIPVEELLGYMEEAAKGIDFLNLRTHHLGDRRGSMQHCDIKPENILLIGNSAQICDFGVSQVLNSEQEAATSTSMIGSPAYMSPECVQRKPSAASDQYSLALTYYELRTGKLPFDELSLGGILDAHRNGKLNLSSLPPAEQWVIRKATAVNPASRYGSSTEMVRALREAVADKPGRQARLQLLLACGILAAAVIGLAVWFGSRNHDATPIDEGPEQTNGTPIAGSPDLPEPVPAQPPRPQESADAYARKAMAAVQGEGLDAEHLAAAVADYRRAIELDPAGPYTIIPSPEFTLKSPADGQAAGASRALRRMAVADDQRRLVAAGDDGRVWMWRLDDPAAAPVKLAEHSAPVWNLAIKEQVVISSDMDGTVIVTVLDGEDGRSVASNFPFKNQGGVVEVALSGDAKWLATGGSEGRVRLWNLNEPQAEPLADDLGKHEEAISAIVFSSDQRWVLTAGFDNVVRKWPVPPNSQAAAIAGQLTGDVNCLIALAGGNRFAFAGEGMPPQDAATIRREENRVCLANPDQDSLETFPFGHEDTIQTLAGDATGRWLASGAVDGSLQVWPVPAGQTPSAPVFLHGQTRTIRALAFCPLPGWLISASDESDADHRVALWRLAGEPAPTPMWLTGHQGRVAAVAATARWIVTACDDGAVRLWSLGPCLLIKQACEEAGRTPRASKDAPLINAQHRPSAGPPAFALAAGG